jgi:hypothetical protein
MITLTLRDNVWHARWSGPEAASVCEAFGIAEPELPTPYTNRSDPAAMLRAIAGRNTDQDVRIAHPGPYCECDMCQSRIP